MLLFFTGAEEDRPTYRRGILDSLSYPSRHLVEFSYRQQNIQPNLLTRDLRGQNAVIIFVDIDASGAATYMPLRVAEVVKHSPFGNNSARDRIGFTFRLGEFVTYPDPDSDSNSQTNWHSRLALLDPDRKVNNRFRFFVIESGFEPSRSATANAWEDVVTAVARSTKLHKAIFVKLELRNLADAESLPLKAVGEQQVYQMRPGTVYALDLAVYTNPPAKGATAGEAKITLSRSSELLEVGQPFQSVVSGLAQQRALISCKRTVEKNLVALGVTAKEPVANEVNTPHPFFLLRISLPWEDFALILGLVFLGSFLVALDKDSMKEVLPLFAERAALFAVVAKWFGAGCLALAAFLGLRKLPSGAG